MKRQLVGRNSNGRIDRAIKVAFTNAKAKIPKDTGTLMNSLKLNQTKDGFNIHFETGNINPKSKKSVRQYIDYVEIYHEKWWDNTVHTFFDELSRLTRRNINKKR